MLEKVICGITATIPLVFNYRFVSDSNLNVTILNFYLTYLQVSCFYLLLLKVILGAHKLVCFFQLC